MQPSAFLTATLANSLKEVLRSTAEEILGRQRMKIQFWFTNEIPDPCDQRRQLKKKTEVHKH